MCVCFGQPWSFQEAEEKRINRSPTQLSFPSSDSTLDMFRVIRLESLYSEIVQIFFLLLLLFQLSGKAWFCMCPRPVCVLYTFLGKLPPRCM